MTKKRMKMFCLVTVFMLVLGAALSGCGGTEKTAADQNAATKAAETKAATEAPAKKVTLRFAYNWTGGDSKAVAFEPELKAYAEKNKDTVELSLEGTPGMEHQNKIKVDMAGGNLPDLFMYWTGESNLKPLTSGDLLLDIDKFFAVSTATKREQWNEGAFINSRIDGIIYTLPVESFKGFFVYNKTLFDKFQLQPPKTYADLVAVSKVFTDNGIIPINMGSKGGNPGHLFVNAIGYQLKDGWNDSKDIAQTKKYNTPANLQAAKIIDDMRKAKMFPSDTIANGDWGPAVALYNEQKAAMLYCFPWKIGDIKKEIADVTEVIAFPKIDGAEKDPADFSVGGVSFGLVISQKAFEDKDKQAAVVAFADFLVSDEMFNILGTTSMMPAKPVKLDASKLNPLFVKAAEFTGKQKEILDPTWALFPGADTGTTYAEGLDELFAGAITPEKFVEKMQKKLDTVK